MKMNRTKNTARNIKWGIIEKSISLLVPFVTRTVLIKILGVEYLGLSSLFTSVLSVLSLAELGLGTAIVFSMYEPIANDDNDILCALLNIYRKIYYMIGCVVLIIGLVLVPFIDNLISGDIPHDINIYILYFIYLFNLVISYFLFAYKTALFSAHHRNDIVSKRATVVNLISNVLKIVVLVLFRNYYVYTLVIPVATICTNLLNAKLATKYYPHIKCIGNISKEMSSDIKKRMMGLISFKVYHVVFSSVDTLIISAFLGLVPLAIFNNYYYLQSAVGGFISIFTASMTAGIGNKMITNSIEDNYKDFKKFVFMNGWIVGWCSVCLMCLYQPFMTIWVGKELLFPFSTVLLMVLYFTIPKITTLSYLYREAAGLWWEDRFRPIIATISNLLMNFILVQIIGMNGVIVSTILCSLFINIPWGTIILFKSYFKMSPLEYFEKIVYYLFIIFTAGVITYFVCGFVKNFGIVGLIMKMLICVIIPNVVFFLSYYKTKEFKEARILVKRIIKA